MKASLIITSLMGAVVLASPAPSISYKYLPSCSYYLCKSTDYYKNEYQYKTSVYNQCLQRNKDEYDCQSKCPLYKPQVQTCKPGWKDILDYGKDYYYKYGTIKNSGNNKPSKEYSDNTSVVWGRDAEAAEEK